MREEQQQYSGGVAAVFAVNLIVGVGSLTLAKGVFESGLLLGLSVMALFSFWAFVTATWVVELMSTCNAMTMTTVGQNNDHHGDHELGETESTIVNFEIKKKIEYLELCSLLLGPTRRVERWTMNLAVILYLYGDLAIYAAAVPLSLVRVFGKTVAIDGKNMAMAAPASQVAAQNAGLYRILVLAFAGLTVPFCFCSFQKTRLLQFVTGALRQFALALMIVLALVWIRQLPPSTPPPDLVKVKGLRRMIGLSAYCFMVHHSLPSIVTPLAPRSQKFLRPLLLAVFASVFTIYALLAISTNLAFGHETRAHCPSSATGFAHSMMGLPRFATCKIQQLVSLNFEGFSIVPIAVFLSLYLAFTLPFNLVMIAITLRNNLLSFLGKSTSATARQRAIATLVTVLPPFLLAFFTWDVEDLVAVTGLGGLLIIFVAPARLFLLAKPFRQKTPSSVNRSPFQHSAWAYFCILLGVISLLVVLSENVFNLIKK